VSKRHDAIFDDVLKGMSAPEAPAADDRGGTRFLRRANALADAGAREEKVLRWVDPESCVMWARHNRAYDLLNAENCRDLIDSLKAQGQQEFPAIVRRHAGAGADYEVICGARRHFAVSWLRANNYPQFRYLVELRDLTDEEAFRLSDIENRDREDLSDFERARDYAAALDLYYGGRQKAMAERLEVSEGWLSRYLQLARLPAVVVAAWPSIRELKELHARALKPLLAQPDSEARVLDEASRIAAEQQAARAGQGALVPALKVLDRLKRAGEGPRPPRTAGPVPVAGLTMRKRGKTVTLEFPDSLPEAELRAALDQFLAERFGK
jgi:ParB family chromosome partitioning protein